MAELALWFLEEHKSMGVSNSQHCGRCHLLAECCVVTRALQWARTGTGQEETRWGGSRLCAVPPLVWFGGQGQLAECISAPWHFAFCEWVQMGSLHPSSSSKFCPRSPISRGKWALPSQRLDALAGPGSSLMPKPGQLCRGNKGSSPPSPRLLPGSSAQMLGGLALLTGARCAFKQEWSVWLAVSL